ncbi:MAG: hypothetical protein QXG00_02420 [Candidatus Woesearchaeota archaeon]
MNNIQKGNINFRELFSTKDINDEEIERTDDYYDQEFIDDIDDEEPEFAGFLRGYLELNE